MANLYTIQKRRHIKPVKSKYWEKTTKYGIRIPKTVKEAIDIDKGNGDTLWQDAIHDEMNIIRLKALEEYHGDPTLDLIGFQQITGHLVFDVKLGENFRRKARYCADGHKTETPLSVSYTHLTLPTKRIV